MEKREYVSLFSRSGDGVSLKKTEKTAIPHHSFSGVQGDSIAR